MDLPRAERSRLRRAEHVRDVLAQLWGDEAPPGPDPVLTLVVDALAVDDGAGSTTGVVVQEDGLTHEALRLLLERSRTPLTRGVVPRELLWRIFAANGGVVDEGPVESERIAVPASAGGWEFDATTGTACWDRRTAELLDLATVRHGALAVGIDLLHPDDLPEVSSGLERSCSTGEPFEATFRVRGSRGHYLRRTSVGRPVTRPDGTVRVVGFLSS